MTLGEPDILGLALSPIDTEVDEETVESKEAVGKTAEGDESGEDDVKIL